jgi:hypothetical protein
VKGLALIALLAIPTALPTPVYDAQGCFEIAYKNERNEDCTARVCPEHIDVLRCEPAVTK